MVLSEDEWSLPTTAGHAETLIEMMSVLGVEVIWDKGNIRSHKKLIPTLERYPDNPILVTDDDVLQNDGWLYTFLTDHEQHPDDIIYGVALSKVVVMGERIREMNNPRRIYSQPGMVSINLKPANGGCGTLYQAHTFSDKRFFDRDLLMRLSPTSDETWQWAFCIMAGKRYRCLSKAIYPTPTDADQTVSLWEMNKNIYDDIHNAIAEAIPEYKQKLKEL